MVVADLDGAVRAMVGGRDYGASQFNRATDAMRQPGSSFKPYVYSAALMNGMKPTSIVVDGPVCIGNWCPHNYSGGYSGSMTLVEALRRSIDVALVVWAAMVGSVRVVRPRPTRRSLVVRVVPVRQVLQPYVQSRVALRTPAGCFARKSVAVHNTKRWWR